MRKVKYVRPSSRIATSCFEDELLICCARVSQSETIRERFEQILREPIDWPTVLSRSWWHRIRPLTYRYLRDQPAHVVPTTFLEELGGYASELNQRNQRLLAMQRDLSSLFERSAIPMLAFKGPTLAIAAYGDVSLRECGDLDILIRREDFPRVRNLLTTQGFSCLWDQNSSERKRQVFACEFNREGVELDVHWDLAPAWHNYRLDFDRLWTSGHPFEVSCRFAKDLGAEDAVSVLCMHGTRHWWERLRWICDIAELVNCGRINDWNRVEATARRMRCHRSVWLGLWLAGNLLDANLSPEIQSKLDRSPVVQRLATQVGGWLEHADRAADARKLPDRFLFRMRLCDRLSDRLTQLACYLVTLPSRSAH